MFLTADEVVRFTGYKQPLKQIQMLKSYGIRFFVAADGHPRVVRTDVEQRQRSGNSAPDFSSLDKAG